MNIDLLNFTILALACFRLTRLIVFDKITEFLRDPFFDEIEEENEEGKIEVYYLPKETAIKKFIGEMLSCYWCTGVWVSAAVVGGYLLVPVVLAPIILVFAVAGLAAIVESIVQLWI
ncbi:hypothetical protein QFZ28_004493 [Neobacillus niacini]|jgi:hypothetical protein|uniref:DUF1360 domain-containing protein n=1 Tax=Neobacillus niacini TaxID=86668 RepID=UPI002784A040|nr:DUF1360 domain-containing protein [Neobacillus niacini]MDQ1004093.1 hypothetical protein [Neobacillus niacini]